MRSRIQRSLLWAGAFGLWSVGALALSPALSVLAYLYRGRLVWLLGEQEGAVLGGLPSPR